VNDRTLLSVGNISKNFHIKSAGILKAVNDVSLNIVKGECLGLVGESGCGKSTLGRAVLRIAPLNSGNIRFMGDQIGTLTNKGLKPYRAKMQMVFQDPKASLNPKMTIFKILKEALVLNTGVSKADYLEQAVKLLNLVDLRCMYQSELFSRR